MYNLFGILNIGKRALFAQQRGIDVTSHNIANVNTPGYSRQRAIMGTTPPLTTSGYDNYDPAGQHSSGVEVTSVNRIRDTYLDFQIRDTMQEMAAWQEKQNGLNQIESIFLELYENALNNDLDEFWGSWQQLTQDPTNLTYRMDVIQKGKNVANSLERIHNELVELRKTIDATLDIDIAQANMLADKIAELNIEIMQVEATGANANDLRDSRDVLVEELSGLVDIQVHEDAKGAYVVSLNEINMVQEGETQHLDFIYNDDGTKRVIWKGIYLESEQEFLRAHIAGGKIGGMLDVRDEIIPKYRNEVYNFIDTFVTTFNTAHRAGFDQDGVAGVDFFTVVLQTATYDGTAIQVNVDNIADPRLVAAAGVDTLGNYAGEGDNANALLIAQLQDTINPEYVKLVGKYGEETENAGMMVNLKSSVLGEMEERRQSISGVSLDEEMTHMIQYQKAYQAAARIITAVDEMLDVVINRMGIVGR